MLKIRDDVDLKELEKFGFRKKKFFYELNYVQEGFNGFIVDLDNRQISNYSGVDSDSIDTIYDLIKAGLVVKE